MKTVLQAIGSSSGVVIQVSACGERGLSRDLTATISEIGYLLLPSCDTTKIKLQRHKSSKQPNSQKMLFWAVKLSDFLLLFKDISINFTFDLLYRIFSCN